MPSLCGSAEATREWFRAFTAHSFLACRPLRPRGVRHRCPDIRCRHWPSPNDHRLGTPDTPAIRFARAVDFVASLVRFATACQVARPPVRIRLERPAFGDFYFQAFNGSVSLPVAGYNYNSDWTPCMGLFLSRSFSRAAHLSSFISFFVRYESLFLRLRPEAVARRSCQGWSPLRRPAAGLGVDSSEHGCTVERSRAGSAR